MRITVLGSGGWGTALALLLTDNGHRVTLWSHSAQRCELLRRERVNPRLPGVALPEALELTDSLEALGESEVAVMAAPSFAVRETARKAAPFLAPETLWVSAAKGIERDTALRMTEILEQETGRRAAALSGPSHAEEVGRGAPTGCVAAARDLETAQRVQDVFMNPRFRVYTNEDLVGVELGAALKNVLALCCGISDGMGLGDNAKALLMTRGMTEMARLGVAMGGRKDTFAGLAGMGDLIVTCTSMHSRNRRCGILIGQGRSAREAAGEVGAVVEGCFAALSAQQLAEKMGVEMPICRCAYRVIYEDASVESVAEELMRRSRRREVDESWIGGM
ncbi:MAG: NAD(P)-dependent glycerol-3-phosphate dehydrogenase [Oscillospiraceae bacterium]|nr:NAD(P)-dependent glycerol-3-phosphate dehydrogenase [Oscillospiraceae bacterium]